MSSWPCLTGFKVMPAAAAIIFLYEIEPGSENAGTSFFTLRTTRLTIVPFTKPSMSPMVATTTCLTLVLATTCCKVVAKFSSTMMASEPESISWCCNSRGVYSGLTLTTV